MRGIRFCSEKTKRLTSRNYLLCNSQTIVSLSFTFLTILVLAAFMILPRWIPRGNPEGVYDARIWLANCLCDDGRAFLVVTNHQTCQTIWLHPGEDFINMEGTWENKTDDGTLVFTFVDETEKSLSCKAKCYWGGMEWTVENAGRKQSFWFPRLLSGVCCDCYNKSFWLNGLFVACCIITAGNIILAFTAKRTRINTKD